MTENWKTPEYKCRKMAEVFPLGTAVIYQHVKGRPESTRAEIRSAPWVIGSGQVVVKITGKSGGVSVDHLMLAD